MNKQIILALAVFGSLVVAGVAEARHSKPAGAPQMVRVAIVRDAREVHLAIHGQYRLLDVSSGRVLGHGAYMPPSQIRLLDRGILVGLDVYPVKRILIESIRKEPITIDDRPFRGEVMIIRTRGDRLTVVNRIDLEDYIKGVLYHEVSHRWPMEALKAQAVASRTYTIYSLAPATKDYDVTNDIYSQVYGGRESERYRTDLAVERTRGEVLVYQGKILPAFFHATCGGMTEDAHEIWSNVPDIAPLRGVVCPFCKDSPHMQWKKNFRLKDIQDTLNRHGYKIGAIKDIAVVGRDRSERIEHLKITDRDGHALVIRGTDFRAIMGPNVINSNNYQIIMKGYYVDFIGKGWGHGVGLCQWGARGMALQQFNYRQILAYYYPESQLVNYHELKEFDHNQPETKSSRK